MYFRRDCLEVKKRKLCVVLEKIKIQHYVPQFYLRNFANKDGSTYFTNCFDKVAQKIYTVNIDSIAAEKYFYDDDEDTNQSVERKLGQMEATFSQTCSTLVKEEDVSVLSPDERKALAYFVTLQEVRTREFREMIRDMLKQLAERLSHERLAEAFKKQLDRVSAEGYPKEFQIDFLIKEVPYLAAILNQMKWVLLRNKTSMPYWTSDHPVNRHNPNDLIPYGNLGLRSPGIEIYFPLSPKLALMICDPRGPGSLFDEKFSITDVQNVIFQNHLQVKWSTRHIFSPGEDFSLAQEMLKETPELGHERRKRMRVT